MRGEDTPTSSSRANRGQENSHLLLAPESGQHRPRVFSQFSRQSPERERAGQVRGRAVSFGGTYSAPPSSNEEDSDSYSGRVVQFLRQPGIFEQLRSRTGEPVSASLR